MVLTFVNLTSRNILRVFNFTKMATKHKFFEKMYPQKLVLIRYIAFSALFQPVTI